MHFKVRKLLNPHSPQSTAPATKSAPQGPSKYCHCHETCTSRSIKVLPLPRNLHFKVHQVLRLPRNKSACHVVCTSRSTKSCACHKICAFQGPQSTKSTHQDSHRAALPKRFTARALTSKDNMKMPKRSFRSRLPPTSQSNPACPKVTTHCSCHEIRAHRRPPPCPKHCACHELCSST